MPARTLHHTQTRTRHSEHLDAVSGPCEVTGETYTVYASRDGLDRWLAGELIQKALPTLSADDREFLISGTSPTGWNTLFGDEDEE